MGQADSALKEIIQKCGSLDVYEKRRTEGEYCELVFFNKDEKDWARLLTDILGTAAKPPEAKPSEEDSRLAKDYGGIYSGQTLFKKEFDGDTVIAMFWPWQDRTHTTLKMALIRK
jgi:hypothetical protein